MKQLKTSSRVLEVNDFGIIACPPTSTLKLKVMMSMLKNILHHEIQDHKLKFLMVSCKAFNLLIQESYDVKRVAYARSKESTNRMLRTLKEERKKRGNSRDQEHVRGIRNSDLWLWNVSEDTWDRRRIVNNMR